MKKKIWNKLSIEDKIEYLKIRHDAAPFVISVVLFLFGFTLCTIAATIYLPYLNYTQLQTARLTASVWKIGTFSIIVSGGIYLIYTVSTISTSIKIKKIIKKCK